MSRGSVVMHETPLKMRPTKKFSFALPYGRSADQRAHSIARHATFLKFPNNKPLRGQLDYRHVMNNGAPKELLHFKLKNNCSILTGLIVC